MCDSVPTRLKINDKVTEHLATRSRRMAGVSEKEKIMDSVLIMKAAVLLLAVI